MIILLECLAFQKKYFFKNLQRSDLTPQINSINYLKIYSNIIENKNEPNYLTDVFIKSDIGQLTVYNESNIFIKQKSLTTFFII